MNELNLFTGSELTEKKQEAIELHFEIKRNGEIAAGALVEFAKGLKKMRDNRLYSEIGFESFDDYAEKAVGIRQRQAYNYISVLESFGELELQSNAKLGITKLAVLAALPASDRRDVIENENVDEMSVKQLKELTDKLTAAEEQITFFKEEVEALKEENENEAIKADDRAEMLEGEIKRLRDELKAEKEKPAAVVAKEPSPDELKKLAAAAAKEATDKLKKKHEDEIQKAKNFTKAETEKSVREELAAEYQKKISAIESEKNSALERLSKMESDSKIAASPELIEFRFYFNEIQEYAQKLNGIIESAPNEAKEKLINAMKALAQLFEGEQ